MEDGLLVAASDREHAAVGVRGHPRVLLLGPVRVVHGDTVDPAAAMRTVVVVAFLFDHVAVAVHVAPLGDWVGADRHVRVRDAGRGEQRSLVSGELRGGIRARELRRQRCLNRDGEAVVRRADVRGEVWVVLRIADAADRDAKLRVARLDGVTRRVDAGVRIPVEKHVRSDGDHHRAVVQEDASRGRRVVDHRLITTGHLRLRVARVTGERMAFVEGVKHRVAMQQDVEIELHFAVIRGGVHDVGIIGRDTHQPEKVRHSAPADAVAPAPAVASSAGVRHAEEHVVVRIHERLLVAAAAGVAHVVAGGALVRRVQDGRWQHVAARRHGCHGLAIASASAAAESLIEQPPVGAVVAVLVFVTAAAPHARVVFQRLPHRGHLRHEGRERRHPCRAHFGILRELAEAQRGRGVEDAVVVRSELRDAADCLGAQFINEPFPPVRVARSPVIVGVIECFLAKLLRAQIADRLRELQQVRRAGRSVVHDLEFDLHDVSRGGIHVFFPANRRIHRWPKIEGVAVVRQPRGGRTHLRTSARKIARAECKMHAIEATRRGDPPINVARECVVVAPLCLEHERVRRGDGAELQAVDLRRRTRAELEPLRRRARAKRAEHVMPEAALVGQVVARPAGIVAEEIGAIDPHPAPAGAGARVIHPHLRDIPLAGREAVERERAVLRRAVAGVAEQCLVVGGKIRIRRGRGTE